MGYDAPGTRVDKTASRTHEHGLPAVEGNQVGWAFKTKQLDRWTKPTDTAAHQIAVSELFVLAVGGTHEIPLSGGISGAAVNDLLYINDAAGDPVVSAPSAGGTNEVQQITIDATAGNWTYTLEGDVTAAVAFNVSAANLRAAIEGLPAINPGDVTVTGGPGAAGGGVPYVVTFVAGQYAGQNAPQATVQDVSLTGGGDSAVAITTVPGVAAGGSFPLGVIEEIDTTRTPHVARVNTNSWQAFARIA